MFFSLGFLSDSGFSVPLALRMYTFSRLNVGKPVEGKNKVGCHISGRVGLMLKVNNIVVK